MNEPGVVDKVAARLTVDISPWEQQLQRAEDLYKKFNAATSNADAQMQQKLFQSKGSDTYLANANQQIRNVRQSIEELQTTFKQGSIDAQQLYDKLDQLRKNYADAFDTNTSVGFNNDQALKKALINAEREISKFQDFQLTSERKAAQQQAQIEAENIKQTQLKEKQAQDSYFAEVDRRVKEVQLAYTLQTQSAQETYDQLATIYEEDYTRFEADINKKVSLLTQMNNYEKKIAADQAANQNTTDMVNRRSSYRPSNHGIVPIGVLGMGGMMAEFTGIAALSQNIMTGLVQITQQQQGLQQVFGENIKSQQQLNDVTNQFIGIASQYGQSVTSVLDASKQWGRQYHDIATAQELVRSSTLLSIVDNMDMTDSAKALEATMNAMGMSMSNAAEAQKSSMNIVDQWSNMAHNASVSAQDLAQGTQVAAGAAHQAGLSLAQLNALIAAGVRNSGLSGTNIGNMYKTVLANIAADTPKIQKAFKELGIAMTQTGEDGKQHMRPVYDLLVEMASKSQDLTSAQQQAMLTITRGVQQYSKFAEAISNVTTIQNDYQTALNSSGKANEYAQEQLHTLSAELQRLRDSIQQFGYNLGQGGVGDVIKTIVVDITALIDGIQKLPKSVDYAAAGFLGIFTVLKMTSSVMNTFRDSMFAIEKGLVGFGKLIGGSVDVVVSMAGATASLTADLNAKVIATEADVAANEAEVVAAGAAATAFEGEAGAAAAATAAVSGLDLASGGLTIAIGAAVALITMWAINLGKHKDATDASTMSATELTQALQKQTSTYLQNAQQVESNVASLEDLKKRYADTKAALANAKQGSDQYKQAEADLITVEQQLASTVGQSAADRILSSNNVSKALDEEVKSIIKSQITELKTDEDRIIAQQALTDAVVKETQKRMDAYGAEAAAAQDAQRAANTGATVDRFGLNAQGQVPDVSNSAYDQFWTENQRNAMLARQAYALQLQYQKTHQAKPAGDPIQQEIDKLQLLMEDPTRSNESIPGMSLGALAGDGTAAKKLSSSAYKSPFQDIAQQDSQALKMYEDRIKALNGPLTQYNNLMNDSSQALGKNMTDYQAMTNYVQGYQKTLGALKQQNADYNEENAKIHQLLPQIQGDINKVNEDLKKGTITDQEHRDALSTLNSEYDNLTSTLNSNSQAIEQNNQKITQATQQMQSEIISMMKAGYQDEQALQKNALQSRFDAQQTELKNEQAASKRASDAQIANLQSQKDAIDELVKSLQAQWNAQNQVNQLTDLQNQLAQVMSQRNQEIIGPNGQIEYTYDTAKAADLQKQILDQQTTMEHDAEIKRLQDQSNALGTQITNLRNYQQQVDQSYQQQLQDLQTHFDEQKSALSSYWQWRLSDTQLQQQAELAIQQSGYKDELAAAQKFVTEMNQALQLLNQPQINLGAALSGSLPGSSYTPSPSSSGSQAGKTVWPLADKNGHITYGTNYDAIVNQHGGQWLNHKWVPGHYVNGSFIRMSTGGMVPTNIGTPGQDSVPAMLTPGEIVAPSWQDLMQGMHRMESPSSQAPPIHIETIALPNVTDAPSFVDEMNSLAQQLYYHAKVG